MEIYSDQVKAKDNEILSTKAYMKLEPILQEINRNFVRIEGNIKKRNVECFQACTEDMIRRMKMVNQTFRDLYQEVRYTGSYFEGSRVREPNEFDINLVLRKPFDIAIHEDTSVHPGYVQLLVTQPIVQTSQNRDQSKWVQNGVISAQNVNRWLEGVVSLAFHEAGAAGKSIIVNNKYCVKVLSKSGPAITLQMQEINASNRIELIDVDFVPVFEFQHPTWPKKTRKSPTSCNKITKWCVTPKIEYGWSDWRLSFPFHEKEILHDKPNLKSIYRLMKRLRDSSVNLKRLKSYYIKTLFLWKVDQLNTSEWKKSLGQLFMMMLYELQNCLQCGKIPFFWDRRMNMIETINSSLMRDLWGRISNIKGKICRLLDANDMPQLTAYMYSLFTENVYTQEEGFVEIINLNSQFRSLSLNPDFEPESQRKESSSWSCVLS